MSKVYYVVRKNTDGTYLLTVKNDMYMKTADRELAAWTFSYLVNDKQRNECFVLFSQEGDSRYLQILRER